MEIQRLLLLVGIAVVTYMMILSWNEDYGQVADVDDNGTTLIAEDFPSPEPSTEPDVQQPDSRSADVPMAEEAPGSALSGEIPEPRTTATAAEDRLISVDTDVMQVQIDRLGGDIVRIALPDYPRLVDTPNQPFVLMERSAARTYVAQTGIVGANGTDSAEGRPTWQVDQAHYRLGDHDYELDVDLYLRQDNGARIIKRYTFQRGSYLVRVSHIVLNDSDEIWQGALYGQIKRDSSEDPGKARAGFIPMPTYLGAAYWSSDKP